MAEPAATGDEFQRELLELFAAEAYEWLAQIQQALARFQASLDPSVKFDALDIISRGITSLGGSAATVDLPAIQELVFGLLPLLEQLRGADSVDVNDTLANLRDALANITGLVASNTGIPATVTFEAHKPDLRQAKEFLHALHTLRRQLEPEGTQPGTTFKVKGKGMPDVSGRGRGDLLVTVQGVTPKKLSKEQRKLLEQLAATLPAQKFEPTRRADAEEDRGIFGKIFG